jgi:hypothetical protein
MVGTLAAIVLATGLGLRTPPADADVTAELTRLETIVSFHASQNAE